MKQSKLFRLNFRDILRGLIMTTITGTLTGVVTGLQSGGLDITQIKDSALVGVAGGVSYLLKNYFTPPDADNKPK